jgi:hypothetical protein
MNRGSVETPKSANFVYVQLGPNVAPTLLPFVAHAKLYAPDANFILVTDEPGRWRDFPGLVIHYHPRDRHWSIARLAKKFHERQVMAGGYWIRTVERLFAVERVCDYLAPQDSFIHLESDVLSFIDSDVIDVMHQFGPFVGVPRLSSIHGIASILYGSSISLWSETLNLLAKVLVDSKHWMGDMVLLGKALDSGLVQELPSIPSQSWSGIATGKRFILDGAAIGQYLFGQDPLHSNGTRLSGFVNKNYAADIEGFSWRIGSEGPLPRIEVAEKERPEMWTEVVTIHVHSKEILFSIDHDRERWVRAMREANKEIVRSKSQPVPDFIHSQPLTILTRLRIARQSGILQFTKRSVKYLVSRIRARFQSL